MIQRYQIAEIAEIWSLENRYRKWLDVELAITEVWHEWGEVPDKSLKNLKKNACFNVKRVNEIEKKVKHDVIAFLTSIEESVGADSAYLHKGITSYDVVDTALSLLIRESLDIVIKSAEEFREILLKKAYKYKDTVTIGRTHGIHAEPITFGIKYLIWSEEMSRNIRRLKQAKETISVGKISGSVGTYIHFPPEGEEKALQKLNLKPCRVSSQIIQRDRHAEVLFALSILGTTLEKIAVEIRHLQRTEVLEVEEPFTTGQKGSSSMPHKRNPVRCERVSGMARLLRSHLTAGLEDNILWHERDISHSSVERVIFPDAFHTAAFILKEMKEVIKDLNVYPESMKKNLDITNEVYYSQKVLTLLVDKAIPRQKAYELVQKKALESWEKRVSFRKLVLSDQEILNVCSKTELEGIFSEKKLMDGIKKIFERFKGG